MSVYSLLREAAAMPLEKLLRNATNKSLLQVMDKPTLTNEDFLALLSPAAEPHLETLAKRAQQLTQQHFGRTIQLFTPLYLSNHCSNHCVYCGFNASNRIPRSRLSMDELKLEADAIATTGLKHLLILTGESPGKAGLDYLEQCMEVLAARFPSVSIEVFAMDTSDYTRLGRAGVDGLTIFQETYDEPLYAELHPAGPKQDYRYRLDAPQRGCEAGFRVVNIGTLLGLTDWRKEMFFTGLHANWLLRKYPGTDIAISLPRMRPHAGTFQPACMVSDRHLVQIMLALRLFLPRVSITISTREAPALRDNLLALGVTRMSAGVSTAVGGHSKGEGNENVGQFDISDERSVEEMCAVLLERGYQPVFKDWEPIIETTRKTG